MVNNLMVIQEIDKKQGDVKVYQIIGEYFQWTFQTDNVAGAKDTSFFPFIINGKHQVWKRKPGVETKLHLTDDKLTFVDDYGVPADTVIAILLPKGFIPDMIKFREPPYIPLGMYGLVSTTPSGYIQLFYNNKEKRAAIVFHISQKVVFGFQSIAVKIADEQFPKQNSKYADDFFDVTLSRKFLDVDFIKEEDLLIINKALGDKMDLDKFRDILNQFLSALKEGNKKKSESLLSKITVMVTNGVGTASNLVTIADSYHAGGSAFTFINKVLAFAGLAWN